MLLDELNISTQELPGATCCPTKTLIKPLGELEWFVTGARNLALAEQQGMDLLVPCNGCYSSLKTVQTELNLNPALLEEVNEILATVDLEYQGSIEIKHLIEVYYSNLEKIRRKIVKPLSGMRLAVHYGCHMIRPSSAIHFDDPNKPTRFDEILTALGAKSVDYRTKMLCCGGVLTTAGNEDAATALSREKLLEVQSTADALVTLCPSCFMQYDSKQYLMRRSGEPLNVPILYLSELIGLTMGLSPKEMGMNMHRVDTEAFLRKWDEKYSYLHQLERDFDLASLQRCYECGACVDDCPVVKVNMFFEPNKMIGEVLSGALEEVLASEEVWQCLDCYTCYELCPQKLGMNKIFEKLKVLALERGHVPSGMSASMDMFLKTGALGEPTTVRKKLKLPEYPERGSDELKRIIEKIEKMKKQESEE
jgi:heterodisulfide reductase subunit B/Pyruvate/2-oxoacid:ferredoxin oxidoreductase delta subunit